MKLYMESDNGTRIEVKEISSINPDAGVLIFFISRRLRYEDLAMLQEELSTRTNKHCIILEDYFKDKIYGI